MKRLHAAALTALLCTSRLCPLPAFADFGPDDFDSQSAASVDTSEEGDKDKRADELIAEAAILMQDERMLDARTKLMRALERDPKAYRAHMMLSGYYMANVGHFRLALQYAKQALTLLEEKNGKPPYYSYVTRAEHSQILYLISQARLNLDDYTGALDVLDEYASYDYKDEWYSGTRAWVLMKLNRLPEAVTEARKGLREGAEPGRTLNMLGILLSMTGDRPGSLDVFREAIRYELSMGKTGSPATPLNNSGEVYKELYDEPKAAQSWLKATSMPDGCDHVLPSLNLSLLYIDELDMTSATRAMNNFESCVAQFPLRNGEEHKALVHLARGRIDYWNGLIESSLDHLREAAERRQWFGKIGTNEDDLEVGIYLSLSQALRARNHRLESTIYPTTAAWLNSFPERVANSIETFWVERRATQRLVDEMNKLEDLYIRNTDSLIEYPTFGDALKRLPLDVLEEKIAEIKKTDDRAQSNLYYDLYIAQSKLAHGEQQDGLAMLDDVIRRARPEGDALVRLTALTEKAKLFDFSDAGYGRTAEGIFLLSPASIRNEGLKLPVIVKKGSAKALDLLKDSPFLVVASGAQSTLEMSQTAEGFEMIFTGPQGSRKITKATGNDLIATLNKLGDEVFQN